MEQNDIHSPATTIAEALLFSASLRLPGDLSKDKVKAFVDEIMEVVELTPLKNALVGLPGGHRGISPTMKGNSRTSPQVVPQQAF